jgi:hypothetical protein
MSCSSTTVMIGGTSSKWSLAGLGIVRRFVMLYLQCHHDTCAVCHSTEPDMASYIKDNCSPI